MYPGWLSQQISALNSNKDELLKGRAFHFSYFVLCHSDIPPNVRLMNSNIWRYIFYFEENTPWGMKKQECSNPNRFGNLSLR